MPDSSKNNSLTLILASGSPRRKKLLNIFGVPFEVAVSHIKEVFNDNDLPKDIVQSLALQKATEVGAHHPESVIIGADTMVVHNGALLGKPQTTRQAVQMLQQLSNSAHHVFTGVALMKTDASAKVLHQQVFFEKTKVTFGQLKLTEIEHYVATRSPMDKAGAYGIQDSWGRIFVKEIEGDYNNIIGLPVHALYAQLKSFAPEILNPLTPNTE